MQNFLDTLSDGWLHQVVHNEALKAIGRLRATASFAIGAGVMPLIVQALAEKSLCRSMPDLVVCRIMQHVLINFHLIDPGKVGDDKTVISFWVSNEAIMGVICDYVVRTVDPWLLVGKVVSDGANRCFQLEGWESDEMQWQDHKKPLRECGFGHSEKLFLIKSEEE